VLRGQIPLIKKQYCLNIAQNFLSVPELCGELQKLKTAFPTLKMAVVGWFLREIHPGPSPKTPKN
jgi:hypothetical protein